MTDELVKEASKSNGDAAKEGMPAEAGASKGSESPTVNALLECLSGCFKSVGDGSVCCCAGEVKEDKQAGEESIKKQWGCSKGRHTD